jgi:anti-sigma factor RsiW
MDCRTFHERLAEWLEQRLAHAERRAAERHLTGCAACRSLVEPFADDSTVEPVDAPADLAASILERTSGGTCGRAEERLAAFVDGELSDTDTALVGGHVDGCRECAALATALARLSEELPSLAELEPDARFVDDVLGATLPRPRRAARRLAAWREAWTRLVQRPRFALEGAYVASFVLVLVFGLPGSPLSGFPQWALGVVSKNPVEPLKQPIAELESRVALGVADAWKVTSGTFRDTSLDIASGVATYSTIAFRNIREDFGTLFAKEPSEQTTDAETDDTARSQEGPTDTMENER